MSTRFSRDVLESYLSCKRKAFLRFNGQRGTNQDCDLLLAELRANHARNASRTVAAKYADSEVLRDSPATPSLLREGACLIHPFPSVQYCLKHHSDH